jgi:hypothetical protein
MGAMFQPARQDIRRLWCERSQGGETSRCGRLKDRFGLSWQIALNALEELVRDKRGRGSISPRGRGALPSGPRVVASPSAAR